MAKPPERSENLPGRGSAEVAASMFGYGILTFMIPYLFRTRRASI